MKRYIIYFGFFGFAVLKYTLCTIIFELFSRNIPLTGKEVYNRINLDYR